MGVHGWPVKVDDFSLFDPFERSSLAQVCYEVFHDPVLSQVTCASTRVCSPRWDLVRTDSSNVDRGCGEGSC